jgi:hypothetical protein
MKLILSRDSTNVLIFISAVSGALGKSGSFGFAEGSACVSGKAKCATCAVAEIQFFCAVGKKLKHRRVGNECRFTRCPFVVSFLCLCSPVKMVYFFSFLVVCSLLSCRLLGLLLTYPAFYSLFSLKISQKSICLAVFLQRKRRVEENGE